MPRSIMSYRYLLLSAITALSGLASPGARAQTGFSGDGQVTFGYASTSCCASSQYGNAIAVQPDGRIIVAGYDTYSYTTSSGTTSYDLAWARLTPDGVLDTPGGNSMVHLGIGGDPEAATAVAVQADGKIVIAGYTTVGSRTSAFNPRRSNFALARFNADGSLDTSFDTDGTVTTNAVGGTSASSIAALALQPDGKIVVAGSGRVARYNTNGSLDASFGTAGMVTTPVGTGNDYGYSVHVQPNGRVVLFGESETGANGTFALVRYTSSGALDASFGTGGKATGVATGPNVSARDAAMDASGRIVVTGYDDAGRGILARYTAAGALDPTFSDDGITSRAGGTALAVQPDGKVLVVGGVSNGFYYFTGTYGYYQYDDDIVVTRITSNGDLDLSAVEAAGPGGIGSRLAGSSLRLWLDASDAARYTSGVSRWTDRSASAAHLDQPVAAQQPSPQSNALNSRPAVAFNAAEGDLLLSAPLPALNTDALTWFVVYKTTAAASTQTVLSSAYASGAGSASGVLWGSGIEGGRFHSFAHASDGTRMTSSLDTADTQWNLASAVWRSDNTLTQYLEGASMGTTSGATATPTGHTSLRLGSAEGTTGAFTGSIAEVIVFSEALSDRDRAAVEAYLSRKYNLARNTTPSPTVGSGTGVFRLGSTGATVNVVTNGSSNLALSASTSSAEPALLPRPTTLDRTWTITPTATPDGAFSYAITLDLSNVDLEGQALTDLMVYKRPSSSPAWVKVTDLGATISYDLRTPSITVEGLTSFSEFAVGDNQGAALPVELTAFTAAADGRTARLSWTTASETNNAGFTVERQTAPGTWTDASSLIAGHGTTTERHTYTATVASLTAGRHTFRLRQTDTDGAVHHSAPLTVEIDTDGQTVVTVLANGTRAPRLRVESEGDGIRAELYDVLGRRLSVLLDGRAVTGTVEASAGTLPPGTYVVRVTSGTRATSHAVVVR